MKIIVVGCGQVGSVLAYQLYQQGHQVTVIEQKAAAFDRLPIDFQGRTIEGDVLAQNVLHRAQIEEADAVAVVTQSDSLNALVAYIAKTEYHVDRVVAANTDPRHLPIQQAFGVPVIGSTSWGAGQFMELLSNLPLRLSQIGSNPGLLVYELQVPAGWQGARLPDLLPPDRFRIISMHRSGKGLLVSDTLTLESGDVIHLVADPPEIESLKNRLAASREAHP